MYNIRQEKKKHTHTQYDQKQSKKYNNRQQKNKAKQWSRRAKKKIESKKSSYGRLIAVD